MTKNLLINENEWRGKYKDKLKKLKIELDQSELKIKLSQERLNYLLSHSPGVIYTCKTSGDYGVTFISQNAKMQLGYEAHEFMEDLGFWADRLHSEDKKILFAELPRIFKETFHSSEYRFLQKDGTYRWIHDQSKLVRNEGGFP